jgi:hypothetical protein
MTRRYTAWAMGIALLGFLLLSTPLTIAQGPEQGEGPSNDTEIVSLGIDGLADNDSIQSTVSWDGELVLFTSFASNLVPTDTNEAVDVFLRDRVNGSTERISRRPNGVQANASSGGAMMNPIATLFTYYSFATNLVPSDTNGFSDIFLTTRDEDTNAITVTRISKGLAGAEANGDSFLSDLSDDGSRIVYDSVATNLVAVDDNVWSDIFLYEQNTATTTKISISNNNTPGNARSERPRLSADGTYAIYYSYADNLVSGDTNGEPDIFGIDLETFAVSRLSVGTNGTQANLGARAEYALSPDGRYVVFASDSTNLVANDTNNTTDIFLYDRETNITRLMSVARDGTRANGGSYDPSISANGRFIAFNTIASNLYPNDTNGIGDGVVVDRFTRLVQPVSTSYDGSPLDADSGTPQFSEDGLSVTFYSDATNLVMSDTNGFTDIFWRDFHSLIPKLTYMPLNAKGYQPSPCLITDTEPNNNIGNANTNLPLCQNVIVNGTLPSGQSPDTGDYYRVVLTSQAVLTVQLFNISQGSDFDLYLYNSALSQLAVSSNNGNANEQVGPVTLPAGTYYIRVYPDPSDPGGNRTYQLRWSR